MIVNRAITKLEIPVIEVNIESAINTGGYRVLVSEPSEKSLPKLLNEIMKNNSSKEKSIKK
jgi:hypothetical protein